VWGWIVVKEDPMKIVHVLPFVIGLTVVVAGCGDKSPSCDKALNHFYAQNCTMTVGGMPIPLGDALAGCKDTRSAASDCGCASEYDDTLDCVGSVGYEECASCDAVFTAYNNCMSVCT
jgi:hypothetical protein